MIFKLELKARFENIAKVWPKNYSKFKWHFKVQCNQCHEISPTLIYVCAGESQDFYNHKVNYAGKCSKCHHDFTARIVQNSRVPYEYDYELEDPYFQEVLLVDVRCATPISFSITGKWVAKAVHSGSYFDVDFAGGADWCDYDDNRNEPVGIFDFCSRITKK